MDVDILAQDDGGGWSSLLYLLLFAIITALNALGQGIRERFGKAGEGDKGGPSDDRKLPSGGGRPKRAAPPVQTARAAMPPQPAKGVARRPPEARPTTAAPGTRLPDVLEELFGVGRPSVSREPPTAPARTGRPAQPEPARRKPPVTRARPAPPPRPSMPTAKDPAEPRSGWHLSGGELPDYAKPLDHSVDPRLVAEAELARPPVDRSGAAPEGGLLRSDSLIAGHVTPEDLRSVVILSEILKPPLGLRDMRDWSGG